MEDYHIQIENIIKLKKELIAFSNIIEPNIRDIWYQKGEEDLNDFSQLKYSFDIPLYQKMIFRFRNGSNKATSLFKGCDPFNQALLLEFFELSPKNIKIIEFFAWISYGLGKYEIANLSDTYSEEITFIKKWEKNDIDFFFSLPIEKQTNLVNRYNKEFD